MGFNKRKLQDQQREAVEKKAAARRVISLPKQAADQKLAYKFIYVHWQSGRGAKGIPLISKAAAQADRDSVLSVASTS